MQVDLLFKVLNSEEQRVPITDAIVIPGDALHKKPCDPHILCILSTNLRMWCCWFQVVYKISDNQ